MWNSPIEKIYGDIHSQMVKQDEENMMYTVRQAVGYSVDKNELLKALQYDREQYQKGYDDAMCVIEDIQAEIEDALKACVSIEDNTEKGIYPRLYSKDQMRGRKITYEHCLKIIDKHMKGEPDEMDR